MTVAGGIERSASRAAGMAFRARCGRPRPGPSERITLDEPLALALARTRRLGDGEAGASRAMREATTLVHAAAGRHGGIPLSGARRDALAHPVSLLLWRALGSWSVAAELAEGQREPGARSVAAAQALLAMRHFYMLWEYRALLRVPAPPLDPALVLGVRRLLMLRDLGSELLAIGIVADGIGAIADLLVESAVEPLLTGLLAGIARDEAVAAGFRERALREQLAKLAPGPATRLATRASAVGDALLLSQIGAGAPYRTLGLDPREVARRVDGALATLAASLGGIPGTGEPFLRAGDLAGASAALDALFPQPARGAGIGGWLHRVLGPGIPTDRV